MNRANVQRGIVKTWETAEALGLAETYGNPGLLPLNEEFRDLVLSSETTYRQVYTSGLALSHYNILLNDYSYFQFSLDREEYVRYAYYPNPFISGRVRDVEDFRRLQELVEAGLLTHEEYLYMLSDKSHLNGIPMFRYENAPDQRKKFAHPCSHFHIGFHSDNRWPLNRVLTPYAFSLLVFKNYYGVSWKNIGDDDDDEVSNAFERVLIEEKTKCNLVSNVLFEDIEARTFYFG